MEAKSVPSASRLYSTARMKRRANLSEFNLTNDSRRESVIKSENLSNTKLIANQEERTSQKKLSKKLNSENSRSRSSYIKKSLIYKNPSLHSQTRVRTNNKPNLESATNSITSLLDKLSGGSSESNNSLTMQQLYAPGDSHYVSNETREREKIKVLATLLPDEILIDPFSRKIRTFEAALLFSDVSGFTELCEKYDKTGMGGPSRLTEVLNEYIGSMLNIVLSKNGDVCKFGGDAFLCVWKVTEDTDLSEVVHLAIETAVDIQKNCGKYKLDVGVKLNVKIGMSAGNAYFSIIGSSTRKQYVIAGPPIMEVRDAEHMCKPGEIIVTHSAWRHVKNQIHYSFSHSHNNTYIKVHDFGPLWRSAKERFRSKRIGLLPQDLRPLLKYTSRMRVEDIRPFILPPVMRNLDFNRPLEYLTEMRQVAIVFFNIVPDFPSSTPEEIIFLSDRAVRIVSEAVNKSGGVTNKLVLFDKDMIILTAFGLKGFKHELASQVALRCAYSCLRILKRLKKVISVSAGVTTGMVYCGVIGHLLRREYTVMGHPVNMAARLMCSYLSIVSCDRNTFLHSKLESDHFEVLEHQYMKGIQNAGPFYKFTLEKYKKSLKLDETYPTLGREKEIKEFESFLKNAINLKGKPHFMIIFGKARIGKSRLVSKLISVAEKISSENSNEIPLLEICVIPLAENYFKMSYSSIRLIFQFLLGLGDSSSKEEWKDKIISKLGETKFFYLLASLNTIFQINFVLQPQYLALSHEEHADAQIILIKELYSKCFPKAEKWLIVIEDAEFIDEESWKLFKCLSDLSDRVIYLMTVGQKVRLSSTALSFIQEVNIYKITLTEIDKWFYSALACQILDVKAIPVELENLLQNYKSSGNPGWLESFLLSLKQSGSIRVKQAPIQEIKELGLVVLPDVMLETITSGGKKNFSQWRNYLETFEKMSEKAGFNVPVCVLGPNFKSLIATEMELTMDVILLKTFDTLNPTQQLVLKIGSVLGNNIKRNALKFVMNKEIPVEEKPLAKAIKYLFEIKILICAKGNLTETNLMVPRKMVLDSLIQKEVVCECTGLIIPESCKEFPKYASCAYMQFRFPTFRDTVYNLLLDEQKKKFHSSCIEFLRKNTFKCNSCNNMPITNVLGYEENDEIILACTKTPLYGVRSTKLEPKPYDFYEKKKEKGSDTPENSSLSYKNCLLSITERGDCQCAEILSSVYSVLLEHTSGCGRKDMQLEVQLEYASVTLTIPNIPLTMQILEEALILINEMKEKNEYPEICTPYVYCKIYALMGVTKLRIGRLDDSLEFLKTGLGYLKTSYPKIEFWLKHLIFFEVFKLKLKTQIFPSKLIGKASEKKAQFSDLLSECFGLLSILNMYKENLLLAKYASLKALNAALKSNRDFFGLCTAYRTMIEVAYWNNNMKECAKLEFSAIEMCKRTADKSIELYEWEAICELYTVIFQTRHVRAEIEDAVVIGFQSIRIASVIRNTNLKLGLIPDMIFALVQLNRLSEAIALLRELEFMSKLDTDKSSRLWYYTLCLDFHLYTGFMIVPYEICEYFLKDEDEWSLVRDPDAKYRLYTSLWLWCVRTHEWELSKSHNKTLESYDILNYKETFSDVFTRLKRLEGLLITLVHRMDLRSIYLINKLYLEIHNLIIHLQKDVKTVKLFQPRYRVLKCYYNQIRYRDDNYIGKLKHAQSAALHMNDMNLYQWIEHLKMVWSQEISLIQRDFWVEHSNRNQLEWHESYQADKKAIMYSLPLPKF